MRNSIKMDTIYFGKFPSRGDFIKCAGNSSIVMQIDEWLSQSFSKLEKNEVHNKNYNALQELHFTLATSDPEKSSLIGSIVPSHDTSGRPFPFLYSGLLQPNNPKAFIQNLPLECEKNWQASYKIAKEVVALNHGIDSLSLLKESELTYSYDANVDYYEFLRITSVMRAEQLYTPNSEGYSFSNSLIALGLLFQPVVSQGFANLHKFLKFQLPVERESAIYIASFWMDMLSGFIRNHPVELLCLFTKQNNGWYMLVSFHGLEPKLLGSVLTKLWQDKQWIDMNNNDWTADYIENDAGLKRFYEVLSDETQSLFEVRNLFKEIFTGE